MAANSLHDIFSPANMRGSKISTQTERFTFLEKRRLKMITVESHQSLFLKGKPHWVADLTASSALGAAAQGSPWRDATCLEYAASSTIAQFGLT
jgi:hypothetical protein